MLAKTADKIGETTTDASVIGEVKTTPSLNMLEARVEQLTNQVQHLSRDLTRQRGRNRGSKSLSRARSVSDPNNANSWYHTRFANKARKCVKPWSFFGKLQRSSDVASAADDKGLNRFFVFDRNSKLKHLIDSGAAFSVFPVSYVDLIKRVPDENFMLYATNSSIIKTYELNI
ncbi:hypothetical protein AVEN_118522-1 [Araneus ventricosus]|uniref:Peptidase A2 domain-containing protein n=1 Tax=Araneus ventricosus TaxID=182803 RepID=A0A4Y2MMM6_ARAVE|nr:hypothetical protein AVEN_118522-1 [Araneus ventricosus]